MITNKPKRVLVLSNHQIDQTAVSEQLTRGQETQGKFVIKQIDLKFSDTTKARTITLSKVLANGTKIAIKEWANSTAEGVVKSWPLNDGVIVEHDETIILEIPKLASPAPNTTLNSFVIIQKPEYN